MRRVILVPSALGQRSIAPAPPHRKSRPALATIALFTADIGIGNDALALASRSSTEGSAQLRIAALAASDWVPKNPSLARVSE
jgi:hypothetical protein